MYYGQNEGVYPADTLASMTPSYLQNIPNVYEPPYHIKTASVDGNTAVNDVNGWMYDNTNGDSNYGTIWVNCTHTDTKGTAWNTY